MDGPTIAAVLVGAGLIGLAIAFVRNERAQTAREQAMGEGSPKVLRLSVVDIGSMRYFDVRSFPIDAFRGSVVIAALERTARSHPPAPVHVLVLPSGFERHLESLGTSGAVLFFESLRDLGRASAAKTFAYVEGWSPPAGSAIDAIARAAGVELMLDLPEMIPAGARTVREMLDEAAQGGGAPR